MATINIVTPRGAIIQTPNGKAELVWNPGFGPGRTESFRRVQVFIDNDVLRFCSARVPFRTGMLQKSGILGTVVGSGLVTYIAPYAGRQYYRTAQSRPYDANRGAFWFERGKAVERGNILRGAQRLAGVNLV